LVATNEATAERAIIARSYAGALTIYGGTSWCATALRDVVPMLHARAAMRIVSWNVNGLRALPAQLDAVTREPSGWHSCFAPGGPG